MLVVVQAFRLQDRLLPVMPDTLALRRRAPAPSDASACPRGSWQSQLSLHFDGMHISVTADTAVGPGRLRLRFLDRHRFGRPTAISACEKRGLWQCALHLFRDLALEFAR
eukprot:s1093_g9.t1